MFTIYKNRLHVPVWITYKNLSIVRSSISSLDSILLLHAVPYTVESYNEILMLGVFSASPVFPRFSMIDSMIIQQTLTKRLENVDIADDLCILAQNVSDIRIA